MRASVLMRRWPWPWHSYGPAVALTLDYAVNTDKYLICFADRTYNLRSEGEIGRGLFTGMLQFAEVMDEGMRIDPRHVNEHL